MGKCFILFPFLSSWEQRIDLEGSKYITFNSQSTFFFRFTETAEKKDSTQYTRKCVRYRYSIVSVYVLHSPIQQWIPSLLSLTDLQIKEPKGNVEGRSENLECDWTDLLSHCKQLTRSLARQKELRVGLLVCGMQKAAVCHTVWQNCGFF